MTDFLSNENMTQTERLYRATDKEYQIQCVGYMYGKQRKQAEQTYEELPNEKIADAMTWFSVRDLPSYQERHKEYENRVAERNEIAEKYGISFIDAVAKWEQLKDEQWTSKRMGTQETAFVTKALGLDDGKDFANVVASISLDNVQMGL